MDDHNCNIYADRILFKGIPFPISDSQGWMENQQETLAYLDYMGKIENYILDHWPMVYDTREIIKQWFLNNKKLVLDLQFILKDRFCFNEDGKIERNNGLDNLQILNNVVCKFIKVDKRFFLSCQIVRVPSNKHCVDISIKKSFLL